MKVKSSWLWILSLLLVLSAAVYQRLTGPTYPVRGAATVAGEQVRYRLLRSYDGPDDAEIRLAVPSQLGGYLRWRRTPSHDEWSQRPLERQGGDLVGRIPHQPPAGKVMYQVFVGEPDSPTALTAEPVTIRFKGAVPLWILIPHVITMFLAMLYSTRCGMEAIARGPQLYRLTVATVILLCAGGLIMGPIVQKLAFGALWTGWPFGTDLTDNKTLLAALFWFLALWRLGKNRASRLWPLTAAIVLMLVYMIPHSLLGSQLDYTAGGGAVG